MGKKALSVTLDSDNVLWLKGRAKLAGGNVSETLDRVITQARTGTRHPGRLPSVVGMVDLSSDPDLKAADAAVREMWGRSAGQFVLHEDPPRPKALPRRKRKRG